MVVPDLSLHLKPDPPGAAMGRRTILVVGVALVALGRVAGCPASCSLNGDCVADRCHCFPGWRGADCGALDVGARAARVLWPPAERFAAASSWGGSVVRDGKFHRLFVSEMAGGCGLSTWRSNSRIVGATSRAGPLGPFKASTVLVPPFGHNARLVAATARSPHLLLHIGGYATRSETSCAGGVTGSRPRGRRLGAAAARPPLGARVLYASDLRGPWNATALTCAAGHANCDFANPSMAVDPASGAALAAYKVIHGPRRGGAIAFARAPSWRGPYEPVARRWNADPAIPCGTPQFFQCEDPFLWRDARGHFHVLFHHGDARTREDLGGHAFSADGLAWDVSPSNAYPNNYTTADGVARTFKRPQRPQLLLDDDGLPRLLVLGVAGDFLHPGEHGQCAPPAAGPGCDKAWTLGVPVGPG